MRDQLTTPQIEAALRSLAVDLDGPDVDLAARVVSVPRRSFVLRPAIAAAAAVVVAVALVVVIEPARTAVADWLGIGGTRIEVTDSTLVLDGLPPVVETLGAEVTAAEAADHLGRAPSLPTALGDPDLWLVAGARATAAWVPAGDLPEIRETGIGALLSQGPPDDPALGSLKQAGPDALVQPVQVGAASGFWIEGDHLRTARDGRSAVAANVLLWVDGGVEYRLESSLDLGAATAIAESVGAGD